MAKKKMTYDELYWMYKGWVVLILKQFMYKAYDDSARVLSFITDYKLYDSPNGVSAAGPDKDKIMKLLAAHHVNYVICEYGEITEMRSFPDNRFFQYLPSSRSIPVEMSYHEDVKDERIVEPPPQKTIPIASEWLKQGVLVLHKKYGNGIISSISKGQYISFSVMFTGDEEKKFVFPDAFEKEYLEIIKK